ncbi:MAG: hypothetical protein CR971_01490 [candidate division SR1 bacterium]|nr:MAG: hypothetical protein CR971_01490 [candidate division SR1 bacterium]
MPKKYKKNNEWKKIFKDLTVCKEIGTGRELGVFFFFTLLFLIIIIKLINISIFQKREITQQFNRQHTKISLLKAKRGGIYVYDKSKKPINLTENITLYNIFLDPKYIGNKTKVINILTPIIYKHLCEYYGLRKVNKIQCIKNIELFSSSIEASENKNILPKEPEIAYLGSGIIEENYHQFKDMTGYNQKLNEVIAGFTKEKAEYKIKLALDNKIKKGKRKINYLAFVSNNELIQALEGLHTPYIEIKEGNYIYINPHSIAGNTNKIKDEIQKLSKILMKYGYPDIINKLPKAFKIQEYRYVKIASNVNSEIAHMINTIKEKYKNEIFRDEKKIPTSILHGLGLEENTIRYYPLGSFLSNVLGYVDKHGNAHYGIEEYFNDTLKGTDGEIEGRASSLIGNVGANEFDIKNVQHGDNIYLTIDVGIQKKIEAIAKESKERYKADSVSILVYNPFNGEVKAATNYPTFNPNNYNNAYTLKLVDPKTKYVIDDTTQVDIPVYIKTGGQTKIAKISERQNTKIKKYIPKNIYGASVFTDKNFSLAYDPGSIFKVLTVAIGLDTDEIDLYDLYDDPGKVKVGRFSIVNADKKNCKGEMPFLDALVYSCNIGMVRIAQRLNRNMFYNYVKKLGFGQKTNIEIANEVAGTVKNPSTISKVGYFNNTFGQAILVTPIQMVVALGATVNGGYYVQPTIVKGQEDPNTGKYTQHKTKIGKQVFKPQTSKNIRNALYVAMEKNPDYIKGIRLEGKHIGGKSGTSEIAYHGKYMKGAGRTNGSYIGVDNTDNPQYIILVQVRRPRSSQWSVHTAGITFKQVVKFILAYTKDTHNINKDIK